jgi:arsenical pump membrane protein
MQHNILIWIIAILSIFLTIIRPFKLSEAYWPVGGALMLTVLGLISYAEAFNGIMKGFDVYMFLAGMMLLAEVAREEKLFDWLAALAVSYSNSSPKILFLLVYCVGIFTTVFLSNDATAVVLTPAVFAAAKKAKVESPLPFLLICAFIANAASFVLPISNPANLVMYEKNIPPLFSWLRQYTIPSLVAIVMTYIMLLLTQRKSLQSNIEGNVAVPALSVGGKLAGWGIIISAFVLAICSAFDIALGLPTMITGITVFNLVVIRCRLQPLKIISKISWAVLPMVAGLFVIVESLIKTGLVESAKICLEKSAANSVSFTTWNSGIGIALISNITNNLPSGLMAANAVQASHIPSIVQRSLLIGVDLGPNLSVTGSLATILWLVALRREGQNINFWQFLKLGVIVMFPPLLLAILSLWI